MYSEFLRLRVKLASTAPQSRHPIVFTKMKRYKEKISSKNYPNVNGSFSLREIRIGAVYLLCFLQKCLFAKNKIGKQTQR